MYSQAKETSQHPPYIGEIIHVRNPNLSIDVCRPAVVTAKPTEDGKIPATTFTSYAAPSVGYVLFWHRISDCKEVIGV